MLISAYYKEDKVSRAEVHNEGDSYSVELYDARGELIERRSYPGRSLMFVEGAAEDWTKGYQLLNG